MNASQLKHQGLYLTLGLIHTNKKRRGRGRGGATRIWVKKKKEHPGVFAQGRARFASGGEGPNKNTPRPPPRESEKLGGGLDPPPREREKLGGGQSQKS